MAAAAVITGVTLAAQAAPVLIPIIKNLVVGVQNLFGHNNGTGQTKQDVVVKATEVVSNQLSTAGKIPGVLDTATIISMVEGVVQVLKAAGVLPNDAGTVSLPSPTVTTTQPTTSAPVAIQGLVSGSQVIITGTITLGK